jgi:hypothetical protein
VPSDLAQAMIAQKDEANADDQPVDLLSATIAQTTATVEITANIKTLQAFDAMLEELTRMKQPQQTEPSK